MRRRRAGDRTGSSAASVLVGSVLVGLVLATSTACGDTQTSSSPTASSAPLEGAPAVSVHPVLGVAPCGTDAAITVADRTRTSCYRLGPAFVLPGDLVNPRVDGDDDAFSVVLEIDAAARTRADAGFAACRAGVATCPAGDGDHGTAAVVVDRIVESALVIDDADIVDTGLVLEGDLTEDDAYRIVDSLNR